MSSKVFLFGLQSVGKTSILHRLKKGTFEEHQPTVKADSIPLKIKQTNIVAVDLPGQERYRSMWSRFLTGSDLLLYILDAADPSYDEARSALAFITNLEQATDVPLLVCVNKSDLNPITTSEVTERMKLGSVVQFNKGGIAVVSAKTGEGLNILVDKIITLLQS